MIHNTHRVPGIQAGKTCYIIWIKHFFSRPWNILHWLIPRTLTPGSESIICGFPSCYQKWKVKNTTLLFRLGMRARSGSLTDVSIMVVAKSCLYQTQRCGLTIAANGHICHGTDMRALSVCAVCSVWVAAFCCIYMRAVSRGSTKQKANWCHLQSWKYILLGGLHRALIRS